jgi:hypothetical protein
VLQVAVTTTVVLPLEEDKVPKDGAVKEGQAFASHVGIASDQAPLDLQVVKLEPTRV